MKKFVYILPVALLILASSSMIHAQIEGCVDSPENPTALLALFGAVGAGLVHLRNSFRGRN